MITITRRHYTVSEKQQLFKELPRLDKRIGYFVFRLIGIIIIFLIPLLLIQHYVHMPSAIEGLICIMIFIIGLAGAIWQTRKADGFTNKMQRALIDTGIAEVVHVRSHRAVRMDDSEDYGVGYFLDVNDKGTRKTLFLWGQYLDELDETFPNTEFELIRKGNGREIIHIRLLGSYFEAERTLPPFYKEDWLKGKYPADGDLLDTPIDRIGLQ